MKTKINKFVHPTQERSVQLRLLCSDPTIELTKDIAIDFAVILSYVTRHVVAYTTILLLQKKVTVLACVFKRQSILLGWIPKFRLGRKSC